MIFKKRNLLSWCLLVLLGCTSEPKQAVEKIAIETLFRLPEKVNYQLSPDGKYLAFLAPFQNRMNIHVQATGSDSVWRVTSITERDIAKFGWASNQRLYFLRDEAGDENYFLSTVAFDGSQYKELTRFKDVRTSILDELDQVADEMLIELNQRDIRVFDVYRIHLGTGDLQLELQNPGNYSAYLTDHDGIIRLITTTNGVTNSFLYREKAGAAFKKVLEIDYKNTFRPVFFDFENPAKVYAISNLGRDKAAAVKYDLLSQREDTLLFEAPNNDVNWIGYSKKRKKPTLVHYTDSKGRLVFLDAIAEGLYNDIRAQLGNKDEVTFSSIDESEENFVIRTFSDRTLGTFYYYSCSTGRLDKLSDVSPWLKKEMMASVKPISYTSRDGLTIHGYLTLPVGATPKGLPVVVMPHGGRGHVITGVLIPMYSF